MVQQSLSHVQTQDLRQEQIIAPHQIQSLEMLTASLLEMETLINHEVETNPCLERLDTGGELLVGNPVEFMTAPADVNGEAAAQAAEKDEFIANLMQLDASWRDSVGANQTAQWQSDDADEKRRYFFDSLTARLTIADQLHEQLRVSGCSARLKEIGEVIIGSISDSGYLRSHLKDLAIICNAEMAEMEETLRLIQSFDPPGVGGRDLRESLLLQLQRQGRTNTLAYKVVDKYLDKIGKNRIPEVAKALKVSPATLYDALYEIRRLQPRPGNSIESDSDHFVIPEIFIEKQDDGELTVRSNKDHFPRVRISSRFLSMLEDPTTAKDVRDYIKEKIASGTLLMKSLAQRQSTIVRTAKRVVEHQKAFFRDGEEAMKPLTMSQVAEEIGVHETTVSRAIANKYAQTPRGVFPLRHFFSSGFETEDGDMRSSMSIRHEIQSLVADEDPAHPLSDQQIVDELKAEGLSVARRTVAKYRDALGILSSHQRKSHG